MPNKKAIDLSHWNTVTNWSEVAKNTLAVIHKATEGHSVDDDTYEDRKADALAAGLLWGAYHFLRPGDMKAQAKFFVDTAGEIDLYAADHEDPGVSLNDLKEFLTEVEILTGKLPVIYSGHVIKEQVGQNEDDELARYRLWLAQYTNGQPSWPKQIWPKYWIWQYTDQGSLPGIQGYVDLNNYQGNNTAFIQEFKGDETYVGPPGGPPGQQEAEPEAEPEPVPPTKPAGPETELALVKIHITSKGNVRVHIIDDDGEIR